MRFRANADYFSSLVDAAALSAGHLSGDQLEPLVNTNVSGNWNEYSLSVTADRNDYFGSDTSF